MSPWIRLQRDRLALACMGFLGGVLVLGLLAPILPLSDPTLIDVGDKFAPWSWHHPFGTDQLGRDVLSRLVYGIRATVFLSLLTMAITSALGACVGLVSGFFRNRIDDVLMRVCDVMMSFPSEVMILAIVGMTGPGLENVVIANVVAVVCAYGPFHRPAVFGQGLYPVCQGRRRIIHQDHDTASVARHSRRTLCPDDAGYGKRDPDDFSIVFPRVGRAAPHPGVGHDAQ